MTDGDDAKQDEHGRDFERWALAGVAIVMVAAVVVVLLRAGRDADDASPVRDPGAIVDVRIGGGAAADVAPAEPGRLLPLDDPWPTPPDVIEPPQPPPDPVIEPPAVPPRTYVVQKGETLSQIARRELGSVRRLREIVELNRIRNPDAIRAGDELLLPPR